jgi:hypothetical protein
MAYFGAGTREDSREPRQIIWKQIVGAPIRMALLSFSITELILNRHQQKKPYSILSALNQDVELKTVSILKPYMRYVVKLTYKYSVPNDKMFAALISELDAAGIWTVFKDMP